MKNQKLNILYLCSSQAWGGTELFAVDLAKSFLDRGHKIIFAAHPKSRIIREAQNTDVKTVQMNFIRHFDPFTVLKLIKILHQQKIDIIHCHLSRDLVHVYWAVKFSRRIPVILHKHVSSGLSKKDFFHRQIYSKVSRVVVLSNFVRRSIIDTCPISPDKVVIIPGGVNLREYDVAPEVRSQIRKGWEIGNDTIVFGTVCRIDKAKGLEDVVRAFAELVKNRLRVRLVIVGESTIGGTDFKPELQSLIESLGIEKEVIFIGYRSDIPQLLSAFDIFILASHEEAFGLVLIEALAARLPVIATRAGGTPDIVEDGVCGLLVSPRDHEGLYAVMHQMLMDESHRNKFRYAGRLRVEERFAQSHVLDRIENLYQELISDRV
jgi:glycosyltransferase involved in cell wall biosynthesis